MKEDNIRFDIDSQIRSAWHAISRMYNEKAKVYGVTTSLAFTLLNIGKDGVLSTQLGPNMGMEARSLTRTLKRMDELGLINKEIDNKDRRKVRITLTPFGLEKRKEAAKEVKRFNQSIYQEMGKEKMDAFFEVMQYVLHRVNNRGEDSL
jgi:DNA-binding MarR family transcriptional regulator